MVTFDSTDFDNAASENGVIHESVANTDHDNDSVLRTGYPYTSFDVISSTPDEYFPLQEDSGDTAYSVYSTNEGSYDGTTLTAGNFLGNSCPRFDGVDDDISSLGNVPGDSLLTLGAWCYPLSLDDDRTVWSFDDAGELRYDAGEDDFVFNVESENVFVYAWGGLSTVSLNTWYFLGGIYDGDDIYFVVIDESGTTYNGTYSASGYVSTGSLCIGSTDFTNRFWDGYISEAWAFVGEHLTVQELEDIGNLAVNKAELSTTSKTV